MIIDLQCQGILKTEFSEHNKLSDMHTSTLYQILNIKSHLIHKISLCITSLKSGFVTVSVRDSGTGLSPENISRLFQEGVQFNANELQVNTAFSVRILMISR